MQLHPAVAVLRPAAVATQQPCGRSFILLLEVYGCCTAGMHDEAQEHVWPAQLSLYVGVLHVLGCLLLPGLLNCAAGSCVITGEQYKHCCTQVNLTSKSKGTFVAMALRSPSILERLLTMPVLDQ
jgi:hypothetical protein